MSDAIGIFVTIVIIMMAGLFIFGGDAPKPVECGAYNSIRASHLSEIPKECLDQFVHEAEKARDTKEDK